jgi:hypothetical protein
VGITDEQIEEERNILTKRFKKEASWSDALWGALNKETVVCASKGPQALGNLRHVEAMMLAQEGRLKEAMVFYLNAYCLNAIKSFTNEVQLLKGITTTMQKSQTNQESMKEIFFKECSDSQAYGMSAAKCWAILELDLKKMQLKGDWNAPVADGQGEQPI